MRTLTCLTLAAVLAAVAVAASPAPPAAEPAPLLKAVTPPSGNTRVRLPVQVTGNMMSDAQFKAKIPPAKGKKGEYIDVVATFDTIPGKSAVSAKKWKSWGYEVPANKIGVLPELIIPASQLAPKISKGGRDVEVRIPSVSLEIVDPPGNSETIFNCDLFLRINDVTKNADRAFEPRFYYSGALELTAPNAAVKRPGSGDEEPPELTVTTDPSLVPVSGAMTVRHGVPMFAFASINGLPKYKLPDGKEETVNVGVSSSTNWPGGIYMTMGTARGCGVELDNGKDLTGTGTTFESTVAKGTVKEFRLAFQSGPGLKAPKDLVLTNVTVYVDKSDSNHFVWLGAKFVNEHLKDGVYLCGSDGAWKLMGRAKPEILLDMKTRAPATPPKK
jgi:hypothetical protein